MTFRETVVEFHSKGKGLGHFNFSDSNQLKAIAAASKLTGLPVVAGLSEGEREYFPFSHARALVDIYRKDGIAIFLNSDHTYSAEKARAAIDAGVDSIVVDGAKLLFDENIAFVKEVVAYARASGRDVIVEGELGYIGQSSQVMDKLPEGVAITEETMTKADELTSFIAATGVDMMAPAVGNVHGVIASGNPKLSISRIEELSKASSVPLVLHGGSGSGDDEFAEAVKAGIALIHINTDLRVLYRTSLEKELAAEPKQTTPYKFLTPSVEAMTAFLAQKMKLFAGE
jgi:fructose-bisphosphate aldolase, class II